MEANVHTQDILLIAAISTLSAVFGASLYQSIIEGPNFNSGIPESLEHFRLFMGENNPGNFFRIATPGAQTLVFLSLILGWNSSKRWWLLASLVMIVGVDIITFNFHYPRNAIMFTSPMNVTVEQLQKAASEWLGWNHIRVALVFGAFLCSLKALTAKNNQPR